MADQIIDKCFPDGADSDYRIDAFDGYDMATRLRWPRPRTVDEVVSDIDDRHINYFTVGRRGLTRCETRYCPTPSTRKYVTTKPNGLLEDNLSQLPPAGLSALPDVLARPRRGLFGRGTR
jgi:hypothetical protein